MKFADVIKYEGDNKTLIWKSDCEDFNKYSQLIVHESQEAVFIKDGIAQDLFGPGRYTLDTQNLPLLTKALNKVFTGGDNPFHCEVYFINKTEQMAIKWGTPEQFYFNEEISGMEVPFLIGARGEMSIRVENSRQLLVKLLGTEVIFSQQKMMEYFLGLVVTKVTAVTARTMRQQKMSIFTVDEYLIELSECLKPYIEEDFHDYGIKVEKFVITSIKKPENDEQYKKYKNLKFGRALDINVAQLEQQIKNVQAQGDVEREILESQGMATKRHLEGYTYQQERGFNVAEMAASNEGVGQYSNLGIGLGMMTGLGSSIGNNVGVMVNGAMDTFNANSNLCVACNRKLPEGAIFCMYCGNKIIAKRYCKNCNSELLEDSVFCMKCGTKVDN